MDCGSGHCQLGAAKRPRIHTTSRPHGLPGGTFMTQRQPFLHDLNVLLAAPMQAWSGHDGQIRPGGAQGIYCADTRVVDEAILLVSGEEPEMVGSKPDRRRRGILPSPGPDRRRRGKRSAGSAHADTHRHNRKCLGNHPAQLRPLPRHRGRRRDGPRNRFLADGGGEIGCSVAPGPAGGTRRRLARRHRRSHVVPHCARRVRHAGWPPAPAAMGTRRPGPRLSDCRLVCPRRGQRSSRDRFAAARSRAAVSPCRRPAADSPC